MNKSFKTIALVSVLGLSINSLAPIQAIPAQTIINNSLKVATGTIIAGTLVSMPYLVYKKIVNKYGKRYIDLLKKSKAIVKSQDNVPLYVWNSVNFPTCVDILYKSEEIYRQLKEYDQTAISADKINLLANNVFAKKDINVELINKIERTIEKTAEIRFISRMQEQIKNEKKQLSQFLHELSKELQSFRILPHFELIDLGSKAKIETIISQKIPQISSLNTINNRTLESLNEVLGQVDTLVAQQSSLLSLNPLKVARNLFIFPFERFLIVEYWKIYQLMMRLDALDQCMKSRSKELNGAKAPAPKVNGAPGQN